MRIVAILFLALALPAARDQQLVLTGLMVDPYGQARALARVTIGAGITVTPDGAGGAVLSVAPPAAERLVLQAGLWCRPGAAALPTAYRVFANGLYAISPDDYLPVGACLAAAWPADSVIVLERYP